MRTTLLLAALLALAPVACRCGQKPPEPAAAAAPTPPGDPSRPAKEGEALVSAEPVEKGTCTPKRPAPLAKDAVGPVAKAGALPHERVGTVAVTQGSDVWLLGGQTKDAQRTTRITATRLGPDGAPGPWREAGQLPAKRPNAGVALHGGVLHVFGGETGDADGAKDGTDEVFVARPDANANFGPFTKALPLPTPRVRMAAAATQSAVYLIGGKKSREAPADGSVIVARLDERGDVIGYEDAPPLPEPREGASAVVVNRRLYLAGGYFFENEKPCAAGTVLVSVIDADGKPGPWRPTTSVPALPAGAALAASGNVLYLVGGIGDQGDTVDGSVVGSVLCARAGGDGGLSTWRRAAHLADRRYGHSVAVAGGKLFAFGGLVNDVDVLADVLALPLAGAAGRCAE